MQRKLVSETELARILTERMQRLPKGKDKSIARVFRLSSLDKNGCNWIPDLATVSSLSVLLEVLEGVRSEFNLEAE